MATLTISTHGVMEEGGSYNLHAKIPAGGGSLALPYLEKAAQPCALPPGSAELVDERVIDADERRRMVLGSYPRRRAQLLEPFRAHGQFQSLSVERCELFDLPDAAWTDYQVNGDLQALVSRHAVFFRAIFVPSLSSSISDATKRNTFADCLEQKLRKRLSEHPKPLHSFVQVMVLTKQDSTDTPSAGGAA